MENKSNGIIDVNARSKSSIQNGNHHEDEHEIDDHSAEMIELNHRMKTDFMSYCFSFLHDDEEARECIQIVWNKYLQCVGDVANVRPFSFKTHFSFPIFHSIDIDIFRYTSLHRQIICLRKISK